MIMLNWRKLMLLNTKHIPFSNGKLSLTRFYCSSTRLPRVTVNKDAKEVEVIMPGYNYGDLDRAEIRDLGKVTEIITRCRHYAWNAGFLEMNTKLRKTGMTFIKATTIEFLRNGVIQALELNQNQVDNLINNVASNGNQDKDSILSNRNYQIDKEEKIKTNIPHNKISTNKWIQENNDSFKVVKFNMKLGHVGKSSFETPGYLEIVTIHNNKSLNRKGLVIKFNILWVYIDRNTRKKHQLPEWFLQENYSCQQVPKSEPIEIPDSKLDSNFHSSNRFGEDSTITDNCNRYHYEKGFTISADHIDKFGHTNYQCYIDFMLDTLNEFDSTLHPSDKISDRLCDKFVILYHGETDLGDKLVVKVVVRDDRQSVVVTMETKKKIVCSCITKNSGILKSKL